MKRNMYILLTVLTLIHSAFTLSAATSANQPTEDYISRLKEVADVDTEKYITTEVNFPQEDGGNAIPETISRYYSFIYNKAKQSKLDSSLLLAICSASFNDYGDSFSETGYNLNAFLDKVTAQLIKNLERYKGDYKLAIEALLQGTERIDLLYILYGDDWDMYLGEVAELDGSSYKDDFVKATNDTTYYAQVCSYYHKNYK